MITTVRAGFKPVVKKFRNQYIRISDRHTRQHFHGTRGQQIPGASAESHGNDCINTMFDEPLGKAAGNMVGSFLDTLAYYGALLHVGIHKQELLGVPEML